MVVHNVPAMYDVARVALMSQAAYGDQRQTRRVVSAPHDNGKPVVKRGRKVPGLFVREVARLPKAVEGWRPDLKLPYSSPHFGRILRFLIGGGSAAALNLALAYIGVEYLGFRSELQQNFVNLVTMETSLLYSFFIYRAFVWRDKTSSVSRILLRQIPLYHMSAGAALVSRALLFPVLQALGLYYLANILLGIMAGAALNYFLSNRYVFNNLRGEKSV